MDVISLQIFSTDRDLDAYWYNMSFVTPDTFIVFPLLRPTQVMYVPVTSLHTFNRLMLRPTCIKYVQCLSDM